MGQSQFLLKRGKEKTTKERESQSRRKENKKTEKQTAVSFFYYNIKKILHRTESNENGNF